MENNVKKNEINRRYSLLPSSIFLILRKINDVPDIILYSWNFFKIDKNREKQFDLAKRRQL